MNNSVSLISGMKYNQNKHRIREGMRDMERVDTQDIEQSKSLLRNRETRDMLSGELTTSNEEYEELITQFDAVKQELETGIKNYIQGGGQENSNNNIMVTDVANVNISDAKYEGCYADKPSRAIKDMQPEGYVFGIDACAQRAIDNGKTVFGVQNALGNNRAQCFIGDDLDSAKKYGLALKKDKLWESRTANKGVSHLFVGTDGNITLHGDNVLTNPIKKDVYVGSSMRDNVKKIELERIGITVGNKPTNTQKPSWNDIFSVANDGKTIDVRRTDQTTGWGQYLHLEGSFTDLQDSIWSSNSSNKETKYNCPPYFDTSIKEFTSQEAKYCGSFRLIMQDDGNLVLRNKDDGIVWASQTNTVGDFKVDEWLSGSFQGRDFLYAGDILKKGQWIASKSGKNIAMLEDDGNFIVYKSVSPCSKINNKMYGSSYSNAVYTVPGGNVKTLGAMAYIDDDGKKYTYPTFKNNDVDLNDNEFITIGNYNSYDADISSFSATSIQQCEEASSNNPDSGGFVFNKTQQRCFLKGKQMWPRAQRVLDTDCIMKVKAPKINVDESCPTKFESTSSSQFELYPSGEGSMNSTRKCGVSNYISNKKPTYDKKDELLMEALAVIVSRMQRLSQDRNNNASMMPELRNKLSQRFNEFGRLRKEYRHYKDRQYDPTLSKYKEDSEITRKMYNADSTMMALLGVGGILLAMRLMK